MKQRPHINPGQMTGYAIFAGLLLIGFALLNPGVAEAQLSSKPLEPISIAYTVSLVSEKYGSATLGKAQTTLSKAAKGYSVLSATKAEGMAAILMGSNIQESCTFVMENGRAISNHYAGGRHDLKDYVVNFDWQGRKVNFGDGESLDMPPGYVVDTCNLPFAAASFKDDALTGETVYVIDGKKKRIRGYILKSTEQVVLNTRFGNIETLKVVLERELIPERTLTFWLSPENSYVPLKMEELRPGRATTMMVDQIES